MLEQFAVARASGALVVLYIYGLKGMLRIFKSYKDGLSWKENIGANLGKGIGNWISLLFSSDLHIFILIVIFSAIFAE